MIKRSTALGELSSAQRSRDVDRARSQLFDLVVVGGGITGAGVALDAATRGLSVLLLEAEDYAAGTSSKSSKLIHGGLRYLEMLDFSLVREALRERKLLLRTLAPHLVKPVPFIWPLTHRIWERLYLGAGLILYDTMGGAGAVPRHRHLSRRSLRRLAPGLDPAKYVGGIQFFDAIEDDARYAMTVARTAASRGAAMLTRAEVTGLGIADRRVSRIDVHDRLRDENYVVRARHVTVAAGPWSESVMSTLPGVSTTVKVTPSKGIHIIVPGDRIESRSGVLMRTEKSVLFVIPWEGHWLIGDTDTAWTAEDRTPVATANDVEYLLAKVNSILARPLCQNDILGVFAGLRPLVHDGSVTDTAKISREHVVGRPTRGVSVIAGGKYTTYRVMAKDVVDVVVEELGVAVRCRTHSIQLLGAPRYGQLFASPQDLARRAGVGDQAIRRLLDRYGDLTEDLVEMIERDRSLNAPLQGAALTLRVEVAYAFAREGAQSIADVLERRTRIRIQQADSGLGCVDDVARLGTQFLGWSEGQRDKQIAAYRAAIAAQEAAMTERTDTAATAAFRRALHGGRVLDDRD